MSWWSFLLDWAVNDVDAGCAGSAKKEEELPPLTDAIWNLVNRKINLHHEGMLFGTATQCVSGKSQHSQFT